MTKNVDIFFPKIILDVRSYRAWLFILFYNTTGHYSTKKTEFVNNK